MDDTHPSPSYVLSQVGFDNGARGFFECGPLAPSRGVDNFWYDAGMTVLGSEGFAEVIVGKGWRAMTRDSGGVIGDPTISLSEIGDTGPYLADLARWIDDDSQVHSCNGALAYRGLEISMGMLLSALDHRTVTPPVDRAERITERMQAELPADPFNLGLKEQA
jgi:hypothetical protein